MNASNTTETLQALGLQAKQASALMAKASAAVKNNALRRLAALLRENTDALQHDNAKDLARAQAARARQQLSSVMGDIEQIAKHARIVSFNAQVVAARAGLPLQAGRSIQWVATAASPSTVSARNFSMSSKMSMRSSTDPMASRCSGFTAL